MASSPKVSGQREAKENAGASSTSFCTSGCRAAYNAARYPPMLEPISDTPPCPHIRATTFNCAVSVRFLKSPSARSGISNPIPSSRKRSSKNRALRELGLLAKPCRYTNRLMIASAKARRMPPPSLPSEFAAGNRSAPNESSNVHASEPADGETIRRFQERAPDASPPVRFQTAPQSPSQPILGLVPCAAPDRRATHRSAQIPDPECGCKPRAPTAAQCTRADCLPGAAPDSRPDSSRPARAPTESH